MSENATAVAVHACGFESKDEICQVTKSRLQLADHHVREGEVLNLIISGGVPYQKGSEILAHLMGIWLKTDVRSKINKLGIGNNLNIHYATDCFDSSTDVQNILSIAKEKQFANILAISSCWHLWVLKPLYKYWARKLNYQGKIRFGYMDNEMETGFVSKKTVLFYSFYGLLVEMAILFGLFRPLDKFLSSIFSQRKNGYPVSGCS